MSAAFLVIAGWLRIRHGVKSATAFGVGTALGAGLLLVFNLLLYGHAFGLHGLQVLETVSLRQRIDRASDILPDLVAMLALTFPVIFAAVVGLRIGRAAIRGRATDFAIAVLLAAACLLTVPLLVPNNGGKQWGPRYLFTLIPLVCVVMALLLDAVRGRSPRWARRGLVFTFAVAALAGFWANSVVGTRHLVDDCRRRIRSLPAFMQGYPCLAIGPYAVAHVYLGYYENRIFRIRDREAFTALVDALDRRGVDRFLFLVPHEDPQQFLRLPSKAPVRRVELTRVGPPGAFGYFEARILSE